MAMLDQYRDEVLELYQGGRVKQKVVLDTLFKRHGLQITPSTLSRWLKDQPEAKELPPPGAPRVTAEEENFLAQAQVFAWLKEELAAVREDLVNIYARLSVIEDANANRHKLVVDAFHDIPKAVAQVMPDVRPTPVAMRQYTPPRPAQVLPPSPKPKPKRRWLKIGMFLLGYIFLTGATLYFLKPYIATFLQLPAH